jgi:molybdopterin molybdotransferase
MPASGVSVDEARKVVLETVHRLDEKEIAVEQGLDRVLARDVIAAGDVPPFACSAMDGYAVRAGAAGRRLVVVGESRAGAPADRGLDEHEAIRISTGAAIPAGANAVIRQEDVAGGDQAITTTTAVSELENVRGPGEDIREGQVVLRAGARLGAPELGAAVAAGAGVLKVTRRPHAQILCTGDELRAPGEPLGPGEIHNSNGTMLHALAARCGAIADGPSRLPDDRDATAAALARALEDCDVAIVSGGVSVGTHDHVKPALAALGVEELFWGVALQPGRPTWFGKRDRTLVFGLPGNPVSTVVTFSLFVWPALAGLQGATTPSATPDRALLDVDVQRNPRREQALRVRLENRDGTLVAVPNGPQGSHIVTSLVGADALAMIPPGDGALPAGAAVSLERLPG